MSLYWKVTMTATLVNAVILALLIPWMFTLAPFPFVCLFAIMEGAFVGIWSGVWLVPLVDRTIGGGNNRQKGY